MQPVLQLTNVSVSFETPYGEVEAVRDVSWSLNPGEVLAKMCIRDSYTAGWTKIMGLS